jgi:hypothetical protein
MKLKLTFEIDTKDKLFHHNKNLIEFACDGFYSKDSSDENVLEILEIKIVDLIINSEEPIIENKSDLKKEIKAHLNTKHY